MSDQEFEIRPATKEDAAEILEIYTPYILHTAVTFETEVPELEEFANRITEVLKTYPYYVAVLDGKIVAYTYAHRFRERAAFDWVVEVSLYVKENLRGHGIGGKLYQTLEEALAKQGIKNCYACIAAPDGEDPYLTMDSPNFHRHVGYEDVGILHKSGYKFDRWYHMYIMEKFIGQHDGKVEPIRSFVETL